VAKSKSKNKPQQTLLPEGDFESSGPVWTDPNQTIPPNHGLKPVTPRPLLFKITLAMLIGWLIFLTFVAYRVLVS
jgi:hypothetical protein